MQVQKTVGEKARTEVAGKNDPKNFDHKTEAKPESQHPVQQNAKSIKVELTEQNMIS